MEVRFRIISLFVVSWCMANVSFAQSVKYASGDYKCEIVIEGWDSNGHDSGCDNHCKWWVKYSGEAEVYQAEINLDDISKKSQNKSTYNLSFIFSGNKKLEYVKFYAKRKKKNFLGNCQVKGDGDVYCYFTDKMINPCSVFTFNDVWKGYTADATFTFTPVQVSLFDEAGNPVDGFLPESRNITYKVNEYYSEGSFSWYYKIDLTGSEKTFPGANPGGAELKFCGNDIASDYLQAIKNEKSIYLWAVACDGSRTNNTIALDVPKEAPRLLLDEARISNPTCAGDKNGSIEIPISPALLPNEELQVALEEKEEAKYYSNIPLNKQESLIRFTGLPAGRYELKFLSGTYPNATRPTYVGGDYHKYSFELHDPPQMSITDIKSVAVHCHGGRDGKICFLANGGTGNLYAELDGNPLKANSGRVTELTGLGAGKYRLSFRDEKMCYVREGEQKKEWTVVIAEPVSAVAVQLKESSVPTGYGRDDGMISVEASGGSGGGYLYHWEKDGVPIDKASDLQKGLLSGKYGIFVTDGNYALASPRTEENMAGCLGYTEVVLDEPDSLTATVQQECPITCNSYRDGELRAVVSGGVKGYEYQWQVMDGNGWQNVGVRSPLETLGGLKAGNYRVLVWDKNDNYAVSSIYRLPEPKGYSINFKMTPPSCNGETDGRIEAEVSGNNGGYAYQWRGTPIVVPVINGGAGTYTLMVTDRLGCTVVEDVTLEEPSALRATFDVVLPSSAWSSDGEITVHPTGGTPYADGMYRYLWDYAGSTSNPLSEIPADSVPYRVVVSDSHGCELEVSPWLIYPLEASVLIKDSISCFNNSNGALEAFACGGVGSSYHFDWYRIEDGRPVHVSTGRICSNLPYGVYRVEVMDKQGVTVWSTDYNLAQPERLAVNMRTNAVTCYGGSDGKAFAHASGGTPPYAYLWTNGGRMPEIDSLAFGRYLVMVTDDKGCMAEATGEVGTPAELVLEYQQEQLICHGGLTEVYVDAEGGMPPYRFEWDDGSGETAREGLSAGTYTVAVTDNYGCRREETFELEEVEEVSVDLGDDLFLCRDQQKELKALDNWNFVSYRWFRDGEPVDSSATLGVDEAGLYRLEVMTEEGCPGSGEVRVHETDVEIGCNFAMASKTEIGSHLKIVNTSLPTPEYCEWIVPDLAAVSVDREQEELLELVIGQAGIYTIGLKAVSGACEKYLYKDVTVIEEGTGVPATRGEERLISDIQVWPNPNRGHFRIRVNLEKAGDGFLQLYASTGILLREVRCEGNDAYEHSFNETLPVGVYILHALFGNEREAVKIVVK